MIQSIDKSLFLKSMSPVCYSAVVFILQFGTSCKKSLPKE
ncbi:putative lipoprotein [Leptospira weilii str. 2006001853]|uniref:Putative lipoprotein n=2 Tax=Leptospira weilii TaxID=28184 RepID=A0A828Z2X7_9LEPT|nr:putative lipoprotein [Leptospira weilii str. 2006001853]EMN42937.1 putative lipoprotein [Leptospira weilii str. LNT 1234]EMY13494.1 putative lipoprotein [Leptospira weilii str. Ecochallenge]